MSEIPLGPLGSIATVEMGLSPSGESYNRDGIGVPLLNGPTEFGTRHPGPTLFTNAATRFAEPGDILFCVRGSTTGRMNWADQRYAIGRGIAAIRGACPSETMYVRACIEVALPSLLMNATGSTFPNLSAKDIKALPVPLHPMRSSIGRFVAALEDLIENNRRRIALLEQMAQTIYREWFMRFRYPGHEEDELVDSPLGPIPSSWSITTIGGHADSLVDGDWIETKDQGGLDFRLLQLSNIGVGSFRETGNYRYITASTFERLHCTEVRVGDLLISRMPDPVGRAWLADALPGPAITVVDVAILTPPSAASGLFLSQYLNSPEALAHASTVATGTTRKRVSRSVLSGFRLPLPPDNQLARFADQITPLVEHSSLLRRQAQTLSAARDRLLPKLVNGAIDVSQLDADALLEQPAA